MDFRFINRLDTLKPTAIMIKNRTFEWKSYVDNYNKKNFNTKQRSQQSQLQLQLQQKQASNSGSNKDDNLFSKLSLSIAGDIKLTTNKLQKLTELTKRKTLFDDKQQEINVSGFPSVLYVNF